MHFQSRKMRRAHILKDPDHFAFFDCQKSKSKKGIILLIYGVVFSASKKNMIIHH